LEDLANALLFEVPKGFPPKPCDYLLEDAHLLDSFLARAAVVQAFSICHHL
jgi:hypothetical protein